MKKATTNHVNPLHQAKRLNSRRLVIRKIMVQTMAILVLGMAFTLNACSGGGGGDDDPSSSSVNTEVSSSSLGNNVNSSSSVGGNTNSSSSIGGNSVSSSSVNNSSSSGGESGNCTAADNTETKYCSDGTMKTYGSVQDADGNTYKTVVIGTQTWMAENLNYNASGSACYDDDPSNCEKYGRLYNWVTAMALDGCTECTDQIEQPHRGICPEDWHLPSDAEWTQLINSVHGPSMAKTKLRATALWSTNTGTDDFGFAALPGGSKYNDEFERVGTSGVWWSTYEFSSMHARIMTIMASNTFADAFVVHSLKWSLYSVRCVKDD